MGKELSNRKFLSTVGYVRRLLVHRGGTVTAQQLKGAGKRARGPFYEPRDHGLVTLFLERGAKEGLWILEKGGSRAVVADGAWVEWDRRREDEREQRRAAQRQAFVAKPKTTQPVLEPAQQAGEVFMEEKKKWTGLSPTNPLGVWVRADKANMGKMVVAFQEVFDEAPSLVKNAGSMTIAYLRPRLIEKLGLGVDVVPSNSKLVTVVLSYYSATERGIFERLDSSESPRFKLGVRGLKMLEKMRKGAEPPALPPSVPAKPSSLLLVAFAEQRAELQAKLDALLEKGGRFTKAEEFVGRALDEAGVSGEERLEFLQMMLNTMVKSSAK